MSLQNVKEYFKNFGVEHRILELEQSSATVELAAIALGTEPDKIAKTLSFMVDGVAVLIVTSGNSKIDNAKYKAEFHTKAKMLTPDELDELVGHEIGGVCPFGIKSGVDVYLDVSLKRHTAVFPACGSGNSAIELSMQELEKYSNSMKWIDVCK